MNCRNIWNAYAPSKTDKCQNLSCKSLSATYSTECTTKKHIRDSNLLPSIVSSKSNPVKIKRKLKFKRNNSYASINLETRFLIQMIGSVYCLLWNHQRKAWSFQSLMVCFRPHCLSQKRENRKSCSNVENCVQIKRLKWTENWKTNRQIYDCE